MSSASLWVHLRVFTSGLTYPERALSLVAGGCGYGAPHAVRAQFQIEAEAMAQRIIDNRYGSCG